MTDSDAFTAVVAKGDGSPLAAIRELAIAAFDGDYDDLDWAHALGGDHIWVTVGVAVVAHASVIPRSLLVDGTAARTGYVESVAVDPRFQGRGLGALVMERANELVVERYDLGALATGVHAFYESLGWVRWRGRAFVDAPGGRRRTEKDDDSVMVLVPPGADIDLTVDIVCDWRDGEV